MKTLIELVVLDMAGTTVDEHGIVYRTLEDSLRAAGASMAPMDVQARSWLRHFDHFGALLAERHAFKQPVALPGLRMACVTSRAAESRLA